DRRIVDFVEKPKDPPAMPGKPDIALASMRICVFKTQLLIECCARTRQILIRRTISARTSSPHWSRAARLWRTWSQTAACAPRSICTRNDWPIWTDAEITPPAKFIHDEDAGRGIPDGLERGGTLAAVAAAAD